jgi:hypothetical protein
MKYERGIAAPPDMNKRQDDKFGFGPNLFGSTPPPSVGGRAGTVEIEVKLVRPKNNELLPSGFNHGSNNKFKTASLSALLLIWTLKNRVNPAKRVLRTEPFLQQKK